MFQGIASDAVISKLEEDLQTLVKWSNDWQTLFNISKCKVVHMGNKQWGVEDTVNEIPLHYG